VYDIVPRIISGAPAITAIAALVAAITTIVSAIVGLVKIAKQVLVWLDDRGKLKSLTEHPISTVDQYFYVKSTHAKYMMGEESSEMAKLRVIRALKDIALIRIDRAPTYFRQPGIPKLKLYPIPQECFSMPGVAPRNGEYYDVVLGHDHSYKLRKRLDVLHEDDKADFVQFQKPLGTEKFVAEVHFPPARKLTKDNNDRVQLEVSKVRRADPNNINSPMILEEIDRTTFTVDGGNDSSHPWELH
jgi:hypothetical protein